MATFEVDIEKYAKWWEDYFSSIPTTTNCIVCDESIDLDEKEIKSSLLGNDIPSKVCDKCKQAIMKIRNGED